MSVGSKLLSDSGIERNVFAVEVEKVGSMGAPALLWVTAEMADYTAVKLSQMAPGCQVKLTTLARIKAIYRDGIRGEVSDYRNFYNNLSDEEYQATKIQDARTAEWI